MRLLEGMNVQFHREFSGDNVKCEIYSLIQIVRHADETRFWVFSASFVRHEWFTFMASTVKLPTHSLMLNHESGYCISCSPILHPPVKRISSDSFVTYQDVMFSG